MPEDRGAEIVSEDREAEMLVGYRTNDHDKPIHLDPEGLLHHTLVVGQSGSGKSFFVARVIEEIVLATSARVLIIDPNGDFRSLSQASPPEFWSTNKFAKRFEELRGISKRKRIYDDEETFRTAWAGRRFLNLHPDPKLLPDDTEMSLCRRLVLHWDELDADYRQFLLDGVGHISPRTMLGLEACVKNAKWAAEEERLPYQQNDLKGLINSAERFAESKVSLSDYQFAKGLQPEDWYAVRVTLAELRRRHDLWYPRSYEKRDERYTDPRPRGMSDFIDGPFRDTSDFTGEQVWDTLTQARSEVYWDVLTLSLDSVREADSLLVVNTALTQLWRSAKKAWHKASQDKASQQSSAIDKRVPTFVVIDEAQNYAPKSTENPLRARATEKLLQIAAEGRKYGVYLFLATQRPTKLHNELVPECENSCLLRVQSRLDTKFASDALGIAPTAADNAPGFTQGQGLISGRWIISDVAMDAKFAPARSVVSGGGLPETWEKNRDLSEPFHEPVEPWVPLVREFVMEALHESTAENPYDLATLSHKVLRKHRRDVYGGNAWHGNRSFTDFLLSLKIEDLVVRKNDVYLHSSVDEEFIASGGE
jgi:Helicase HerA, central domain